MYVCVCDHDPARMVHHRESSIRAILLITYEIK